MFNIQWKIALKKISALVLLIVISQLPVYACTTFCLKKNGKMVFGRNYDWVTGVGMIHTNLRDVRKSALSVEQGNNLTWTSLYGSVTFNQYGKEFPNGGMNEKGLVVELMWLNESKYPVKDQRPSLSVLQWIQYQLDNAATVEEVIASDKKIRIFSTGTPQHYLVADCKGAVATIEFLGGKMVVHRDKSLPYPVLANTNYETSIQSFNKKENTRDNSLQRFSKACEMIGSFEVKNDETSMVDYAFNMLGAVALGDYTKWSIVYDISNQVIYFKTSARKERKFIHLRSFSFDCNSSAKMYNLQENYSDNVSGYFKNFDAEMNEAELKKAFIASRQQVNVPSSLQSLMADIPKKTSCKN
jgi:penicillin V acylase-like amidase (Ntn superfamily)